MAETIEDVLQRYQELFGGGQPQGMGPEAPAATTDGQIGAESPSGQAPVSGPMTLPSNAPEIPGLGLLRLLQRRNAGSLPPAPSPSLGGPIGPASPSQDFTGGFAQTPGQIPQEELSSINMGRYDTMKPKVVPQGPDMVPLGNRYVQRESSPQEKSTADWWHGVQGSPDTPQDMGYGAPQS